MPVLTILVFACFNVITVFFAVMRCNRPFFSLAAVRRQHNVQSERIQRRQVSTASERSSLACTHSKAVLDHYQQQAGRIPSSQVAPLMYCQCVDRNSLAKNAPISNQIRELLALSGLLSLNIMLMGKSLLLLCCCYRIPMLFCSYVITHQQC